MFLKFTHPQYLQLKTALDLDFGLSVFMATALYFMWLRDEIPGMEYGPICPRKVWNLGSKNGFGVENLLMMALPSGIWFNIFTTYGITLAIADIILF